MTRRELLRLIGVAGAGPMRPLSFGQTSSFSPDVELALRAAAGDARILPGPSTRVWRFTGKCSRARRSRFRRFPESYLGPTLRLRKGQTVRDPLHGMRCWSPPSCTGMAWTCLSAMDGHPHSVIDPASRFHLRVRGDQPRRHVLVSPASAQSHRAAGLQRSRRSPARVRRRGTHAEPAGRAEEILCVLQDRQLRRGQSAQLRRWRHDGARAGVPRRSRARQRHGTSIADARHARLSPAPAERVQRADLQARMERRLHL